MILTTEIIDLPTTKSYVEGLANRRRLTAEHKTRLLSIAQGALTKLEEERATIVALKTELATRGRGR